MKQRFTCCHIAVRQRQGQPAPKCPACGAVMRSASAPKMGNIWRKGWQSQSGGVGINQVAAANRELVRRGLPGKHDEKTGKFECTSKPDRNAFMEAHGFVDCDGGYGDYTGR